MAVDDLTELVSRLKDEGVVETGSSAKRGVSSTLRKLADADYLVLPIERRNRLKKLAADLDQLGKQWRTQYPPLLAVTGLRNAGKSSLVKGFLSIEGRCRTPTGVTSDFATRRYVFWLPESWRSNGQSVAFESMLSEVFGNQAEPLSTDPRASYQQYKDDLNDRGMRYPLVAYDQNLDALNVGIVDCPDIESGNGEDDSKLQEARETLEIASKLCAAFAVVAEYENMGRDIFWKILRIVREVGEQTENILVINKCHPVDALCILAELTKLSNENRFPVEYLDLYASYHFSRRGVERFAISISDGELPDDCARGDEDFDQLISLLPTFFSIDGVGPNPPEPLPKTRLIQSKIQSLSSEKLKQRFQLQMATELKSVLRETKDELNRTHSESQTLIGNGYRAIAQSLFEGMTKNGVIRPLQNQKIADRQTEILIQEAPTTIAISMRASDFLKKGGAELAEYIQQSILGNIKVPFKTQATKVSAEALANLLCQNDGFQNVVGGHKNSEVKRWVKNTLNRFNEEFDQSVESLRPFVKKFYADMSWWEYGKSHALAGVSLAVLFTAACFATLDGGATLFGVSALEGLIIAGGGGLAELAQSQFRIAEAEKPIVEGQLSFLTAAIGAEAGLMPFSGTLEVKNEGLVYELNKIENAPKNKEPRIVPYQSDNAFLDLVIGKLDETLAEKEGK